MEFTYRIPPIILVFVLFFFLLSSVFPFPIKQGSQIITLDSASNQKNVIKDHLKKINKPFVKSIQSPDGDIIDCVLFHLQPAFDHPELKGRVSLDPPLRPSFENNTRGMESELKQLWNSKQESCPHGTVPIRRTNEDDILRSLRISKVGKKFNTNIKTDSDKGHVHSMAIVRGEYYGGQANLNVWAPNITDNAFSHSKIWVASDIPNPELNAIEVGWQVNPTITGDKSVRLFIFWTNDGYQSGCYNLMCSGFIQTNRDLALGATMGLISTYNGEQFIFTALIWKAPNTGDWMLSVGSIIMGYWPKTLFPNLQNHATIVMFGGEVYNKETSGPHTPMGSGHIGKEGFRKAAYIRNMLVVDGNNKLHTVTKMLIHVDKPDCYDMLGAYSNDWGWHAYFGGPGNISFCP